MTLTQQKKIKKIYVCYNPDCFQCATLTRYKALTDRPIIFLGSNCWNCKTRKFLKVKTNEL